MILQLHFQYLIVLSLLGVGEMTSKEHPIYHPVDNSCYLIGGCKGSLSLPDLSIWKHENQPDWWTPIYRNSLSHDYIDPLVAQLQNFKDVITNKF